MDKLINQKSDLHNDRHYSIFLESVTLFFLLLLLGEIICSFYNSWDLENNQNLRSSESIIHHVKNKDNGEIYALALGDSVFGHSI